MIDNLDQRLILELQQSGRRSYVELANVLGISEGTVRKRIKNLIAKDVLEITATPNLDKLGFDFVGVVGLQVRLADLKSVALKLAEYPNVCYLANVTGQYEFIAIIAAKSSKEYADFVETVISTIPSIVKSETFVVLNIFKGKRLGLDTAQLTSNLNDYLSS